MREKQINQRAGDWNSATTEWGARLFNIETLIKDEKNREPQKHPGRTTRFFKAPGAMARKFQKQKGESLNGAKKETLSRHSSRVPQ
ncbi:MAG TPA: hypothetical protein VFY29_13250 [Terriglobia bacterium]|nr:hypothetical protein [Terriglobia bacterium]